jgi:hypothetical protein
MKWVKIINTNVDVFGRIDDDGLMRVTCSPEHSEFVAWLADGNTPEEWNPEVTQPDMEEGN